MLTPKRIDQLLTDGVVSFEMHGWENGSRHWIGREVDSGIKMRARQPDETWQRSKRTTLLLHESSAIKRLFFGAEHIVRRAARYANGLAVELHGYADETGVKELTTDFNRVNYDIMKGSPAKPAVITSHADLGASEGVVAIMGLFGKALPGSVAPQKSAVTLLACQNLCEAVGIEPVVRGSTAIEPRIAMTLAQII